MLDSRLDMTRLMAVRKDSGCGVRAHLQQGLPRPIRVVDHGGPSTIHRSHTGMSRPASPRTATRQPRIDALARPTHDEAARQRFISTLRKRIMVDLAQQMRSHYHDSVEPKIRQHHGRPPQRGTDIRQAMLDDGFFKAWSALRYAAQQQTWWSVQPQVERNAAAIRAEATSVARRRGKGSLRLDPKLPMPRDVTAMDIHLMPGCFHTEYAPEDVSTAALYWHGTAVFSAGLKMRHN
ncbi:MAG: hypothetical protein EBZ91_09615, partial [Gammaproteobacteria bacterium]|nr:hypothetical protein [Gammaproteobacteria bacterium]